MGHKLPQQENDLYKAIDEILWNDWDPIGINDTIELLTKQTAQAKWAK